MKKLLENWRKHLNENEPLHGFPYEPMPEEDAMRDLADKFGVEVEFRTTKEGESIAVVTFEDGEQIGYRDEEEMYQDLIKRAGEGTRVTPRRYGGTMDENTY